jgi:multiple sugar transport system ATP-binding protein
MLDVKGLTKTFGKIVAVGNLSFTCQNQEFLVIFGPAGAGKSTTLRMVAGINTPNRGEVYFDDENITHVSPENRNMSMVFENYALYSHLTVFENLAFPLRARKIPDQEIKQRVQKMADILGLSATLERRPGFLSGGQRQRVALGRGLIREANIYMLDEPISHLDARLRIAMRAELKAICSEKKATVIHVTHDYREAMALADRVIVLNKGKLIQHDRPEEVFHHPVNEFVASFVGDPPMSFLDVSFTQNSKVGFFIPDQNVFIPAAPVHATLANAGKFEGNVRLGVRAAETSLASCQDTAHIVPGEVYVVESQGHRSLVTLKIGKNLIQVTVPPDEVWNVRDIAWLNLNANNLHIFVNGNAVHHPDTGALQFTFSG